MTRKWRVEREMDGPTFTGLFAPFVIMPESMPGDSSSTLPLYVTTSLGKSRLNSTAFPLSPIPRPLGATFQFEADSMMSPCEVVKDTSPDFSKSKLPPVIPSSVLCVTWEVWTEGGSAPERRPRLFATRRKEGGRRACVVGSW